MKRVYFLVLVSLVFLNVTYSQETFSKRPHLGFPASVFTSIEANDSCYYVSGIVVDSLSPYKIGAFFSRFDLDGDLVFTKTILDSTKSYEPWRNTLTPLGEGDFMLTGYSLYEDMDAILMKFTNEGDTIFVKKYKSPYAPVNGLIVPKGFVLLQDGGFGLLSSIEKENGDNNLFLIRTNSLGNILWQKVYGGTSDEIAYSLVATNDGGFIIGAGAENIGLYLIKTDSLGEIVWEFNSSPSLAGITPALALYQLEDGSILISSSYWTDIGQGIDWPNPIIIRLNADQEILWTKTFQDTFPHIRSKLDKILPLPDNQHFLAAGNGYLPLSEGWQNVGKLVKASYEGDSIWTRYYHHVENQSARNLLYDLEATPDGGFIMCGQATGIDNPTPENPNQQGWLLKVDEHGCLVPGCHLLSATVDLQETPFQIKLYPNPARDYLNVYFYHPNLKEAAFFELVDASGKVVLNFTSEHGDITHLVSVEHLAGGVYWLICRVGGDVVREPVVIGG